MSSKVPQLKFDKGVLRKTLEDGFMEALEEFEELLIEEMRRIIDRDGGHTGKAEWREKVKSDLRNLSKGVVGTVIQRETGLPYSGDANDAESMRAFVVAYGTGFNAKGGGSPMTTKPGEMVWDTDLASKHMSEASGVWNLPDSWNRPYTDFIDVAVRNLRVEYIRFIDARKDEIIQKAMRASLKWG